MSKECVWIHPKDDEVVPKSFVENHFNNCLNKQKVREAIDNNSIFIDVGEPILVKKDDLLKELFGDE